MQNGPLDDIVEVDSDEENSQRKEVSDVQDLSHSERVDQDAPLVQPNADDIHKQLQDLEKRKMITAKITL